MNKFTKLLLPLTLILAGLQTAQAGVAVVVSPDNPNGMLSKGEATRLFLKKDKSFKNGVKVNPIDQVAGSRLREMFYTKVANKNESQLTSYWSRMIFTGKAAPPRALDSDESVISAVADNSGAIGYIDTRSVDKRVKVLLTVD